jgi:hypothetical protein
MRTPVQQEHIDKLREFPAVFEALVGKLSDEILDTKEREGEWTVRQIVHHLADSHLNAWGRMKLPLTENHPTIKPYDQAKWAEQPDYRLPIGPSLQIIDGLHQRMVALLESLSPEEWQKSLYHPEAGRDMTVEEVAKTYANHGYEHIAQINKIRAVHGW